jgi:hypothetical protein
MRKVKAQSNVECKNRESKLSNAKENFPKISVSQVLTHKSGTKATRLGATSQTGVRRWSDWSCLVASPAKATPV